MESGRGWFSDTGWKQGVGSTGTFLSPPHNSPSQQRYSLALSGSYQLQPEEQACGSGTSPPAAISVLHGLRGGLSGIWSGCQTAQWGSLRGVHSAVTAGTWVSNSGAVAPENSQW